MTFIINSNSRDRSGYHGVISCCGQNVANGFAVRVSKRSFKGHFADFGLKFGIRVLSKAPIAMVGFVLLPKSAKGHKKSSLDFG